MLVQLTIDTANPKDVAIAGATLAYMSGFLPIAGAGSEAPAPQITPQTTTGAPSAPAATPTAQFAADALAEAPSKTEAAKPAKGGKKKATEAAAPAQTAQAEGELDFTAVKAKLQSYSDDARFGMNGVLAILQKHGVQRISSLAEVRYAKFVAEIDEALAGQPDPLA